MARVYEDKKSGFKKAYNIITNILYVIVMIILIIFIVYGFESLASNKVPSFFGQSYVRIMSGSMEASGFKKGDVVMIKKVNLSNIQEGDIIAFYSSSTNHPTFIGEDELDNIEIKDFKTGKASFDTSIIFHKINDIQYDSEGNTYFQTYGTSNTDGNGNYNYDAVWTRGDRVVGVYRESGLAGFIEFMSSSTGIIVLVIVPSFIVLLILAFSIIDIIDKIMKEKKARQEQIEANIKQANEQNKDDSKK